MRPILNCFLVTFFVSIQGLAEPIQSGLPQQEDSGYTKREEFDVLTGRKWKIVQSYSNRVLKTCRSGQKMSHAELQKVFEAKTNLILIQKPEKVPKELMIYLIAYFNVLDYRFPEPMKMSVEGEGPQLVEERAGTLIFAKNAVDGLFTKELSAKITNPGEQERKQHEITIKFKNTLFELLTEIIAQKEKTFVPKIVEEHFGIKLYDNEGYVLGKPVVLTGDSGIKLYRNEVQPAQKFSTEESVAILKQLIDLPKYVVDKMKLKAILRAPRGYTWRNNERMLPASAIYNRTSQTIWIFDLAFGDSNNRGKFTVTHELGHALFAGLESKKKEEFVNLTWIRKGGKTEFKPYSDLYEIKPEFVKGDRGFVSDYARENFVEDFAESFASFVNDPAWMLTQTTQKFRFFDDRVFVDTKFVSMTHERFRFDSDYQRRDVLPPEFKGFSGSLKNFVKLEAKSIKDGSLCIQCTFRNIHDESPLGFSKFYLRDDTNSYFWDLIPLSEKHLADKEAGLYRVTHEIPLSKLGKNGCLYIRKITLQDDKSNKQDYFPRKENVSLKKSGTFKAKRRKSGHFQQQISKIKIVPIKDSKPEPVFEVTIRISKSAPQLKALSSIWLYWKSEKGKINPHVIDRGDFIKGKDEITFRIHFHAKLPHQRVELSQVVFSMNTTMDFFGNYSGGFKSEERPSLFIKSSDPDKVPLKIRANEVKVAVTKDPATGKKRLSMAVPVEGRVEDASEFISLRVKLVKPSDPKVKSGITFDYAEFAKWDGKQYIFSVGLPELKGTYAVENIEIQRRYWETKQVGSRGLSSFSKYHKVEPKEIGIIREFEISD